ncbi:UbiA family prenyltransferase [Amycolatopsis sp. FDAARGOS 1241]|uniref:UbiA family prenyltransferase n=1 Tax=Amycolatopsis sp. FDAARGOS 1241 TaxID=2778070 RepID=UPI0019508BF8|nr:UbiA family prenyltransferase [Amycolatopsis sp. FDAARGOS 1241]QRP42975.1 UbiA family prenyltransferase [Amycolatopsis sp. FDAARGOS 1241]
MLTDGTAGTDRGRRGVGHGMSRLRSVAGRLRGEVDLTWRMIADNLIAGLLPPIVFSLAASVHGGLPAAELLVGVGKAAVLGLLFSYLTDSSNQARSGEEDALNKPYRPIPAGLATAAGLARRFWVAMAICLLLAWVFGVWPWILIWQVVVVLQYRWPSPRHYLWWKPLSNLSYQVVVPAYGWRLSAPLDATVWSWIAIFSGYFTLAFIYEDVRDMAGDRAVGRRTPALVFGPTFVRRWFASIIVLLPFVVYFGLARVSGAQDWRGAASAAVLAILAWTCAARALLRHGRPADRRTFQLYFLTWGLTLATAPLLLA